MINNILGDRIKKLRTRYKLTQKDLAEKLQKAESTVRMWELGKSEPDKDTLVLLSKIFSVSIDYLLGNETHYKMPSSYDSSYDAVELDPLPVIQDNPELDDFQFALYGEVKDLTDDEKKDILDMVKILKKQKERK